MPDVDVWDWVEMDQRLGVVRHPDGRTLAEIRSVRSGRVLWMAAGIADHPWTIQELVGFWDQIDPLPTPEVA